MAYNIYCLQYFALVKADFFFICVYVFLFVLEMFEYIELVYLFRVLEVFSAWRLQNQFLFTTGCASVVHFCS